MAPHLCTSRLVPRQNILTRCTPRARSARALSVHNPFLACPGCAVPRRTGAPFNAKRLSLRRSKGLERVLDCGNASQLATHHKDANRFSPPLNVRLAASPAG
jgi:hypothetical protein